MDTNNNKARIRVVFIQVGLKLKNGLCGGCSEGDRKLKLLLFNTTVIEYKNNSRFHFSYSDSTIKRVIDFE